MFRSFSSFNGLRDLVKLQAGMVRGDIQEGRIGIEKDSRQGRHALLSHQENINSWNAPNVYGQGQVKFSFLAKAFQNHSGTPLSFLRTSITILNQDHRVYH